MAKQINARIITKHDVAANWAKAVNFVPKQGEIIVYEAEAGIGGVAGVPRLKVGDGVNKINYLKFITDPYVEKRNGYGLSKNDFIDDYKNILDTMLSFGDEIKFTDTTYLSGTGIYLSPDNNTFFNTGLLSVKYDKKTNSLIFNQYDASEGIHDLPPIEMKNIVEEIVSNWQNSSEPFIKSSEIDGAINVDGEDIKIGGLGELAFLNKSWVTDLITDATGDKEIFIGSTDGLNGEKLWIDIEDNNSIIKYRIPNTNEYKIYPFLQIEYNWETPWKIEFHSEKQDYVINTGIFGNGIDIPTGADLDDYINIGIYSSYDSVSNSLLNTPITTTGFKLIVLAGYEDFIKHQLIISFDNSIYYRVLQENKWTEWINLAIPDNFLPLTGGTVTGPTIFSDSTQSTSTTTGAVKISGGLGVEKNIYASSVYGAVWNDYAEFRKAETIEAGRCIQDTPENKMMLTKERLQPSCKIISDTFGFAIGKTEECNTPTAVSGRVLAYTYENREDFIIGDAVCSGPNGTVSRMTREEIINYPDRIIGIVSEIPNYKNWGENNIKVNNRIWIYVR